MFWNSSLRYSCYWWIKHRRIIVTIVIIVIIVFKSYGFDGAVLEVWSQLGGQHKKWVLGTTEIIKVMVLMVHVSPMLTCTVCMIHVCNYVDIYTRVWWCDYVHVCMIHVYAYVVSTHVYDSTPWRLAMNISKKKILIFFSFLIFSDLANVVKAVANILHSVEMDVILVIPAPKGGWVSDGVHVLSSSMLSLLSSSQACHVRLLWFQ